MACARLIVDIDSRIVHIAAQVSMGANQAEVVVDQYNQLLSSISMLRGVDLDGITCISQQLVAQGPFSSQQPLAFSASLTVSHHLVGRNVRQCVEILAKIQHIN